MKKPLTRPVTPRQLLDNGILQKWHDKTWDDFDNDLDSKEKLLKYAKQHEKARKEGVGLYLYGSNGTGKTLALNLLLKGFLQRGYTVRVHALSTLITRFAAAWYDQEEKRNFQHMLTSVDFLGIEEVGKEFKAGSNELGLTVIDHIIRIRLQMLRPTLVTSNTGPADIKTIYTEDIASMLRESCMPLNIQGDDRRVEIAAKNKKAYGW